MSDSESLRAPSPGRSLLIALGLCASTFAASAAAQTVPVTVTITRIAANVTESEEGLEALGESTADLYATVEINGIFTSFFDLHVDDDPIVEPFWRASIPVPAGPSDPPTASVTIRVFDHDDTSADDQADVDPGSGSNVDLIVDLATGTWSGETTLACSQGTGGEGAQVCWDISTLSATGDLDRDGLLDGWEINGLDTDGDGLVDVDLPAIGADPNHKDLFLEMDWVTGQEPTQVAIQTLKAAFAAAPVDAGGNLNPDALPGITLWVDTGNLADPTAAEDGGFAGSCGDGIDNGGDGPIDGDDPDCLVGDDLGGGNAVAGGIGCLDVAYFAAKATNFDSRRRWAFRYAISGDPVDNNPCNGGRGELGGNDFVDYNHDAGTLMHELGHNLNLRHGGNTSANCKPSYVSVMNYDNQFGINQAGGTQVIDYSPPRFPGGRGAAPLPPIVENNLDESLVFDPTDATNRFVFVDDSGVKVQSQLDQPVDWNSDGDTSDSGLTINVDTADINTGRPSRCANSGSTSVLTGFHDWDVVALNFRPFGDSASGAVNPVTEPEMTITEMLELQEALNTTDLAVAKSAPAQVAAGETLDYTIELTNQGPNPASSIVVVDELPNGVTHVSDTASCVEAPAGTLTCELPELLARDSTTVGITVAVAADLVHLNGSPLTITNQVEADNTRGPDPDPADDQDSAETLVVAVADLDIVSFGAPEAPPDVLVEQPLEIDLLKVITNHGPSAPMDTAVTMSATPPSGASVTPASATFTAEAVGLEELREVEETFTITCHEASHHLFTFANQIAPARPEDTDPDPSNNSAEIVLDIECVVPVAINLKGGSNPNSVNPLNRGTLAVTVLTTQAGEYGLPLAFDATSVVPTSVRFGPRDEIWAETGGAGEMHHRGHLEDGLELDESTRDGDLDMVLHFRTPETGLVAEDVEACIKGEWLDELGGTHSFFGCDLLRTVP
jgi:uncharacterized repeat protein (TIGR01451 family)